MLGFEIQRKLDNETDFTATGFVNSKTTGGNSTGTISYLQIDANSYTGTSFCRLKIIDQANNIFYSDVKSVSGKSKKISGNLITLNETDSTSTMTTAKVQASEEASPSKKVTVGPNPNYGDCWFMVSGIEKEATAMLYIIDGKVLKQFRIVNLQTQKISDLRTGVYILKVDGLQPFRIVVQG